MKKILYAFMLALLALPNVSKAQEAAGAVADMWSYPVVYKYDEQVKWYFDLTGTTWNQGDDVYLWIWSPSEPDAGNWNNSSEFAKLTWEHDFVWSFTLTPTTYFNMTPEAIAASAGFWFRLKDDAGTKQSDVANMAYTNFDSFYTANELVRPYPEHPTLDGGLSILFNANLAPGFENATSVHFHSGLNNWAILQEYQAWLPEIVAKTALKNMGNGFWKMDLIPSEYYNGIPDGFVFENITYLFVKDEWAGTIPDQILYAAEVIPPPPPAFKYFPQQISKKDFLGIMRTDNEPGINTLVYTITAGSTEITGSFSGNMAEIKGFVNLPAALQNVNATTIHVHVTDNTDRVLSDVDIPLKTLD
ncbi:hypothetical protein HUK80_09060 [Flavobacterium sp. MAH-1]|uniref:Uncharacterized protein n=1 Tax=Flavobacterium agri TaxID=2743471 RepID=A0A7Y8Y2A1_9FLAO|nr:hypothetical protein [Flavobacterium agri]NUY81041.1 hypothetical protein [Flavobacterium agri]NYA71065.1 hypothetical protein [Flavobacterium agri]